MRLHGRALIGTTLALLPFLAVCAIVVDLLFVTTWSGIAALVGALLLLEPLFLARADAPDANRRTLPSLKRLSRLPSALGTLSRVRRYLLFLFAFFFVLRVVALVLLWSAPDGSEDELVTATRIYDGALAVTGLLLVVFESELHRLGHFALFLAHRPAIFLLSSFAILIGLGTTLLLLPIATTPGHSVSFVDSLFTMTSGVCVTGLVANDFAAAFSPFGQAVTLIGIQLGGIGMMTIAALATTFGRASLERHAGYSATFEAKSLSEVRSLVRTVVIYTFVLEAAGTLVLWLHWHDAPWLGARDALWYAAFHAISAFCNAGFALFSDNLMGFQGDAVTQITLIVLVVTGGLGFAVLRELAARFKRLFVRRVLGRAVPWRRTPVGTKIVLWTSAVLVVGGALSIGASEAYGVLESMSPGEQALNATFASVVARTAGFNTFDLGQLATPAMFIIMILMMIGGSPGSTAGGMKTTTLVVVLATLRAELRGREPEIFGRAIDAGTIRRAVAVAALSLLFVVVATLVVVICEPEREFLALAFDTVSAATTTGLSTGITPHLNDVTKLVLTATMFIGRVGPLTAAYAVGRDHLRARHRLATEEISVG